MMLIAKKTVTNAAPLGRLEAENLSGKALTAVAFGILSATALAGEISWTGTLDSDLSRPENWGVASLSGTDDATINVNAQTFTLGKDVEFNSLKLTQGEATFDFSSDPTKTILLRSATGFLPSVGPANLVFKGGVWQAAPGSKSGFYAVNKTNNTGGSTVFDGATVTGFETFYWTEHSKNQVVLLKNKSIVSATTVYSYATGAGNLLEVTEGSSLTATGSIMTDCMGGQSSATGRNRIVVRDEGSSARAATLEVGYTHKWNEFVVSNQAALVADTVKLGTGENAFRATNATVTVNGDASVTIGGVSNCFEVVDSALTIGGKVKMSGSWGRFLVRGNSGSATIPCMGKGDKYDTVSYGTDNLVDLMDSTAGGAIVFSSAGTHNVYRLGRLAKVSCTSLDNFVGDNAELNLFGEGATGGVFSCELRTTLANNQNGCCLRLNDGVCYENKTESFYIGNGGGGTGCDNTVYVGTNATMTLNRCRVGNHGNRLVVDNGRVDVWELALAYNNSYAQAASNTVVFAGTHPRVNTTWTKDWTVPDHGGFEFNVPAEGYESAPFSTTAPVIIEDASQIVVKADLAAISVAHGGEAVLIPLVSGKSVTVSDGKLASLAAQLGQTGVRFLVENNTLYLRVASTRGLMIILR